MNQVVLPTLRHRILLSYYATAEGIKPDDILRELLRKLQAGAEGQENSGEPTLSGATEA